MEGNVLFFISALKVKMQVTFCLRVHYNESGRRGVAKKKRAVTIRKRLFQNREHEDAVKLTTRSSGEKGL